MERLTSGDGEPLAGFVTVAATLVLAFIRSAAGREVYVLRLTW